jgi:gamma-glutamylcyclotransferase (GGCT)/AIG2-like uncharacterized protein YtfP
MWPRSPVAVEVAEVRGRLFDLGPYPALVAGEGRVAGELWRFTEEDLAVTLAALDRIEGFCGQADDWYHRQVIQCRVADESVPAWTYSYARPQELAAACRVPPDADGLCRWSHPTAPVE